MRLIATIAIALVLIVPSAMALCNDIISAKEGNVITLEMQPTGSYNYEWDIPSDLVFETGYDQFDQITKVRVPDIDDSCTDWTVQGYMESSLLGTADLEDCHSECNVIIRGCPVPCPPTDDLGEVCVTNYAAWTLTVWPTYSVDVPPLGSGSWTTGTKFTWTITETSDNTAWTPTVLGPYTDDKDVVISLSNFEAVSNDHPEKCFDVDVRVVDAKNNVLLDTLASTTCAPIGKVCLVFDPTVIVSGSAA